VEHGRISSQASENAKLSGSMPEPLCTLILAKIHEQIERTDHLVGKIPTEGLQVGSPSSPVIPASPTVVYWAIYSIV
jgi:hypothetical protein